jgi:hypothetical protein
MRFLELENIKLRYPRLSRKIEALATYIGHELDEGRTRIVPALAAVALGQSEAETLALLMLLEDAGILDHRYELVCRQTNSVLASVSTLDEVEGSFPLYCPLCGCEHGPDNVRVELVFEVKQSLSQGFRHHAVA